MELASRAALDTPLRGGECATPIRSLNYENVNMPAMWVIRAEKDSKCFRIYRKPSDRLKELLTFGKRRFHEPFWAVKDVDLEVERGRCLGIIGENGSGKSTLLRRIQQIKRAGVTIAFVSHDVDAVRNLAESTIWMEHGRVALEGKTDEVVAKYLSAMVNRGRKDLMMEEAIGNALPLSANLELTDEARSRIPKFISHVSNIDHRHGNGKALVRGIGVFSREGYPATAIVQGDRICVRISVDFLEECSKPNVGFIVRNRLGEDVTGTNATFEGLQLPPVRAGDRISVDFVLDLPLLQQGFYYFSPAVADGMLDQYDICDWIDNACAVEIMQKTTTYGYMRVPTKVSAFAVTGENSHFEIEQISSNPDETKKQLGLTSRLSH